MDACHARSCFLSPGGIPRVQAKHQGACPPGWHIPTATEYSTLRNYIGGYTEGNKLKTTSGWTKNGTDTYGFSALPAGFDNTTNTTNQTTVFWSSTQGNAARAQRTTIDVGISLQYSQKDRYYSIRCVKN